MQASNVRTKRIDRKSKTTGASGKTARLHKAAVAELVAEARVRARIADYMQ